MIALVDCNSFYASCERLFNPSLEGRPVAILSGPEGCVVCASPELKALGVKVGEPWFMAKNKPGAHAAAAISANFELYGDMSRRVMTSLSRFGLPMEIYSIDEAFLELPDSMDAAARWDWAMKARRAAADCGIPVSVGIGRTKTLAKLSSAFAKPRAGGFGAFDMADLEDSDLAKFHETLDQTHCSEIWGVGPKSVHKLESAGIRSAGDLRAADLAELRKLGTITLARSGSELRGCVEHPVTLERDAAKSISRTRTFEGVASTHRQLSSAVAGFVQSVCSELRRTGSLAGKAEVFIGTHPMDKRGPARFAAEEIDLPESTNDSILLSSLAAQALRKCFKPGYPYRRAGITLGKLRPDPALGAKSDESEIPPLELTLGEVDSEFDDIGAQIGSTKPQASQSKRSNLLAALDALHGRFGPGIVSSGSTLIKNPGTRAVGSARPTTRLSEIMVAKAE